jgi:hypothetical protein
MRRRRPPSPPFFDVRWLRKLGPLASTRLKIPMRLCIIGVISSIDATAVGVFTDDSGFAIASYIATYVNTPWGWAASIRPLFLFLFLFLVFFPSSFS